MKVRILTTIFLYIPFALGKNGDEILLHLPNHHYQDDSHDMIPFLKQFSQKAAINHKKFTFFVPNDNDASSRQLQESSQLSSQNKNNTNLTCDKQFMTCLQHNKCTNCFKAMETANIDWSIIGPGTPCTDVLDALIQKGNVCTDLQQDDNNVMERDTFCATFDSCVIWKKEYDGTDEKKKEKKQKVDCSQLTSCDFPGMKQSYIGDGICHEFVDGCYNTPICNYDGGDCCPDTCKNQTDLIGCGSDGYACRDPNSTFCDTGACGGTNNNNNNNNKDDDNGSSSSSSNNVPVPLPNCTVDETPYRMYQYDSFGDGWDVTTMTIRENVSNKIAYSGQLENGYEAMKYICLSTNPTCYNVKLEGGFWGNEVSWKIHPLKNGAPEIASGGAPMDCNFMVSGGTCDLTCTGRKNVDPAQDKKYQGYHKMVNCIEDKCLIQAQACSKDLVCASCLTDNSYAYCLASDLFNALVFCTECNCVEDIDPEEKKKFCANKSRERNEDVSSFDDDDGNNETGGRVQACSFQDFMAGTDAVIQYSECSGIDSMVSLITDFDPDNFGTLDAFERCASEYVESKHSKSALDCLRILEKAIDNPVTDPKKNAPVGAISALANDLLNNGQNFCDCTADASQATPVCADFIHFKTLLYESLDGCRSLDAVDCDAWAEFYKPCKDNIESKFRKVDFNQKLQCDYIHDTCGNVGPFPSFRRLDCDNEISGPAWDFYLDFRRNCLSYDGPSMPNSQPVSPPRPVKPYNPNVPDKPSSNPAPQPSPWDIKPEKRKKYVPPEKRGKNHTFRNFVLFSLFVYGGYWLYKNKFRGSFLDGYYTQFRARRARNNYGDDGMYDSLVLENVGSSSFVPPSLPPPPSAYEIPMNPPPPVNDGHYNP